MVAGVASAKGEIHDSVNPQLPHIVQPPRAQVLPQLQREVRGSVCLLLHVLHGQDSSAEDHNLLGDNPGQACNHAPAKIDLNEESTCQLGAGDGDIYIYI